jgi:membrane-associated phospholipid phosphatase
MPGRWRCLLITVILLVDPLAAARASEGPPPAAPPPAEAEEPAPSPLREALRSFGSDGAWLVAFPKRTTARGAWITAGAIAGTALIAGRDDEIRAHVLEHHSPSADDLAEVFEPLGTYLVAGAGLGATWLGARAAGSERLASTTAVAAEAWLWTALITSASKGLFGRQPPAAGYDEDDWFDGGTLFPSGHTARSFALAAVFADRYGRRAAWIGYPIAGLVGLATIEQDTHWASDVVAGAALGLAIGRGIASRHRPPAGPGSGAVAASPRRGAPVAWGVVPVRGGATITIAFRSWLPGAF